uniref:Uncharacterized protein n=1 Tax=Babesia bovis TaxID=5865 RepID=A7ASF3_BABBO|eukprot:XP_001611040.1 hypothetical protein [Babesia bovis T2Bo]
MPLCTIDDFEREVLILETDDRDSYTNADNPNTQRAEKGHEYGVFVFYQADIDGVCALFVLEHHKLLCHGLKLTSYPVQCEADIYSFIKKNLSIRAAYPDVQDADWYFFVANEQDVSLERSIVSESVVFYHLLQQDRDIIGGIYYSTSVAALIASVTKTVHDSSRAAVLYASAMGVMSRIEHYGALDSSFNTQITKIFQEITMLDGGPYIQYDSERSSLPLISFM